MIAEILSTGDEILTGALVDTNTAYLSEVLEEKGIQVQRHTSIGDQTDLIVSALKEIGQRADIAIVTGGLGPTSDDLTAEAAAQAGAVKLKIDAKALESVENFFSARKLPMSESNRKQALLPSGAECLYNSVGTAPGFQMGIGKCRFFFVPGVPMEMKKMITARVLPRIDVMLGLSKPCREIRTISVFGLTESGTADLLGDFNKKFPDLKIGYRARFPVIEVKLYATGDDSDAVYNSLERAARWITRKIGNKVVSTNGDSMETAVGKMLSEKKETVAVAESCTGGLISHLLTNVPGSSDYFLFSGVTYANASKINVLGVSASTLEKYGAVSEKTAQEMAAATRRIAGATFGISTSGIAGPSGGSEEKPVGTVCIGLSTSKSVKAKTFQFSFQDRWKNKMIFAITALDMLRKELMD